MSINEIDIDRTSKVPVFRQIYAKLFEEIKNGFYEETGKLPSEKDLCSRFNVERNTVRKALKILVEERQITRVPGIGTKLLPEKDRKLSGRQYFVPNSEWPRYPNSSHAIPVKNSLRRMFPAKQKNNIILLIAQVDYLNSPDRESFHYKLIHNLDKHLSRLGYNLLFKPISHNGTVTDTINSALPQGIIFDSFNPDSCYQEAADFGLPCVSINHYTSLFTSIVSNNFEGAYNVTKELANAGHRRIAFITGKCSHQTSIERLNGVQALCGSRGISLGNEYIISGDWTFASGVDAAKKILGMKISQQPTAIFAFNDDLAYGCYSLLQNKGLSVPKNMSLVGFDKSDRYLDMFPPITTVDVNIDAIVDYACLYLSSILSGSRPSGQAKIQIDTIIRDNGTIKFLK